MKFELKPISASAIPEALEKVERYRLLNEPAQAESICLDILTVDPHHQQALIMLLLAITDQFADGISPKRAREALSRLESDYDRAYYAGIICERRAHIEMRAGRHGSNYSAHDLLTEAMKYYDRAAQSRAEGNDDSLLRWNSCARVLMRNSNLRPRPAEVVEEILGE